MKIHRRFVVQVRRNWAEGDEQPPNWQWQDAPYRPKTLKQARQVAKGLWFETTRVIRRTTRITNRVLK